MRSRTAAGIGLASGLVLGVWLGWLFPPRAPLADGVGAGTCEAASASPRETRLESALLKSGLARLQLAARVGDLEALLHDPAPADGDYARIVREGIATLSDQELQAVLASTIHLGADELRDVRDLRAFTERVADIAMQGILEPEQNAANVAHVSFGTRPGPADPAPDGRFGSATGRIYAVFPTEGFRDDTVLVKWYRRDDPRILLLRRYPVVRGDAKGYVWFRPDGSWDPGQYQVDVYTGDEAMTLLASGHYSVQ